MCIHAILSKIIGKIKHEEFILDERIPIRYLCHFLFRKLVYLIVGICKMQKIGKIFIAPTSSVRCVNKIQCKGLLNIAEHCHIDALSKAGIIFGANVSMGEGTVIECSGTLKNIGVGLKVGNNVGLGAHGFFGCAGGIEIGDDCILGNFVSMHSENHNFDSLDIPIRAQGVTRQGIVIGRDCWIGAKAIILDGTRIGEGCVVAAGAVVRGCIPAYSVIGGVPARILKLRK